MNNTIYNSIIIFGGTYLIWLLVLIFATYIIREYEDKSFLIRTFATLVFSFLTGLLLSRIFNNPRPFVVGYFNPIIAHSVSNGFPSDHMLLASTLAAIIFTKNQKLGLVMFAGAFLVGISRVLAGVHHIEDILGAFAISIVSTYLFLNFSKKLAYVR